jgi:hypothetical protein
MQATKHLRQQAESKGIDIEDVFHILNNPQVTYTTNKHTCRRCGADQRKYVGTGLSGRKLCIATYDCCGIAVTVFDHLIETAIREDQRQAGVKSYKGRHGQRVI